jgi:hypothetical protein
MRATQRQGWDSKLTESGQKSDRDNNRLIRTRQRAIGRELRRFYDAVAKEPVPDEFLNLLQKIDEAEDKRGNNEP